MGKSIIINNLRKENRSLKRKIMFAFDVQSDPFGLKANLRKIGEEAIKLQVDCPNDFEYGEKMRKRINDLWL